jgi:ATP-dependent helicase HepA
LAQSFLQRTIASEPATITAKGEDFLGLGHILGYEDSKRYEALLRRSARGLLETELLEDCLGAVAAWNRSRERESRANRLRSLISEIHEHNPECKLLLFAGFPGLASEIAAYLKNVFGPNGIAQFTYDLSREAKEDAARQFAEDRRVWAMVSDESGGEGRNFQFASSLVHVDHPWHVSRIEQRIGRLDRLGRARFYPDVTSHLVFCKNSIEEALIACYDDGLGVYRKSLSGLEFALRSTEHELIEAATLEGAEGLLAKVPNLQLRAEQERSRDDAEAVLDAASFDARGAGNGTSVLAQREIEPLVEHTFVKYFQTLSSQSSAVRWEVPEHVAGFWRIRPDSVRAGVLATTADYQPVVGSFTRDLAQKRIDLAYFQIGHPVYDDLTTSLETDAAGKTFAVMGSIPDATPWIGFEFVFFPIPDPSSLLGRPDLAIRCHEILTRFPIRVFVTTDGIIEIETDALSRHRRKFTRENRGQVWQDLTKAKSEALDMVFPSGDWKSSLLDLEAAALAHARRKCEAQFEKSRRFDLEEMRSQVAEIRRAGGDASEESALELEMVMHALDKWQLRTDAAGFLAINTELAQK